MAEQQVQQVKTSSKTVTVACKLPSGLILRAFDMKDDREASPMGTRDIKVARQRGEAVKLNGFAMAIGKSPQHQITGGYGLTSGVDAEFFNQWLKDNADSAIVKNGLVFATASDHDTMKEAKGNADVKSNLEPLDPSTKMVNGRETPSDPRYPKPVSRNLGNITTAEERA